jgi:hypothetical protein
LTGREGIYGREGVGALVRAPSLFIIASRACIL